MEERRFDDFTKALAQPVGRRPLLKGLLAVAFGGAVPLARAGAAAADVGGNNACDTWCHANFTGSAAGSCTNTAAEGKGPCYQCGPKSPHGGQGQAVCNGKCTDITTTANCGGCGHACTAPPGETATCVNGQCGVTCGPGTCSISGACYPAGTVNPANACQSCQPAQNTTDWTTKNCDDGNACTIDTCDPATGQCIYTVRNCDDNNLCTTDSCDPAIGCINTPINCDDGNACTTDTCDPATGLCMHELIDCNDGNPCTQDICNSTTGCIHIPDDSLCPPVPCHVATCDVVQGCVQTPITCPTGECCDPTTGMCSASACT